MSTAETQACRWCGRRGPITTLEMDLDYDSILGISNQDVTVDPPVTTRRYACYECYLWEIAIEERCHLRFGICTDAVRKAAMQRYLDQGRWLSIADLNEIGRKQ